MNWLLGLGQGLTSASNILGAQGESNRRDQALKLQQDEAAQARLKSRIALEGVAAFDDPQFVKEYQAVMGAKLPTEQMPLFPTSTISPAGIQKHNPQEDQQAYGEARGVSPVTGVKVPFDIQAAEAQKRLALQDQQFLMDLSHQLFGNNPTQAGGVAAGQAPMMAPNVQPSMTPEPPAAPFTPQAIAPVASHTQKPKAAPMQAAAPPAAPAAPNPLSTPNAMAAPPPAPMASHGGGSPIDMLFNKPASQWTPKDRFMAEFLGSKLKIPLSASGLAGPPQVPGQEQRVRMADTDSALASLDEAKKAFDPSLVGKYVQAGTNLKGFVPEFARNAIPGLKVDPRMAAFQTQGQMLYMRVVNAIAGKQITEGEKAMVAQAIPQNTDVPEVWQQKALATELNLRALKLLDSGVAADFSQALAIAHQAMAPQGGGPPPPPGAPPPMAASHGQVNSPGQGKSATMAEIQQQAARLKVPPDELARQLIAAGYQIQ